MNKTWLVEKIHDTMIEPVNIAEIHGRLVVNYKHGDNTCSDFIVSENESEWNIESPAMPYRPVTNVRLNGQDHIGMLTANKLNSSELVIFTSVDRYNWKFTYESSKPMTAKHIVWLDSMYMIVTDNGYLLGKNSDWKEYSFLDRGSDESQPMSLSKSIKKARHAGLFCG